MTQDVLFPTFQEVWPAEKRVFCGIGRRSPDGGVKLGVDFHSMYNLRSVVNSHFTNDGVRMVKISIHFSIL